MPPLLQRNYAFGVVIACFIALGILFGAWQVMITDLQRDLNLSEGQFGLALTLGVLGSFPAMFLTGRLVDKWGARRLMWVTCVLTAISTAILYWVSSYVLLIVVMFLLLGCAGALDVAVNAAAVNYEQNTNEKKMSFFHAGYSGSAAVAAIITGVLLYYDVPFRWIYIGVALSVLVIGWLVWCSAALDPVISYSVTTPSLTSPAPDATPAISLFRMPLLLMLAAMTSLTYFSEGTLEVWSAVYLRLALDLPVLLGAAGPAIFHIAMMTGRLTSGWVLKNFDRRQVLIVAGSVAAVGMSLSLSTVHPPLILTGFLLAGLALAGIVPIVFSLAGDLAPDRAGQVVSVITMVGYGGLLLGPAIIGGIAEAFGLRVALSLLILAGLGVIAASWRLKYYQHFSQA